MPHLDLKKKLRKVGLFGDAFVTATGAVRQELKSTLLIVGRRVRVETRQEISTEALGNLDAVSIRQHEMLLDLLKTLLAKEISANSEVPWLAWWKEHGEAAFTLYEIEERLQQ